MAIWSLRDASVAPAHQCVEHHRWPSFCVLHAGLFVSEEAIDNGSVLLVPKRTGEQERFVELEGAPDLVVEIVGDGSVKKDTLRLPRAYYKAGIPEFWLVDARHAELVFQIHRRGDSGYEPVASAADGFQHSAVLGCWFRLDRQRNERGRWVFDLHDKEEV